MTREPKLCLVRLPGSQSWRDRADAYLVLSRSSDDDLVKLGYLQFAEYCQRMAEREARWPIEGSPRRN